MLFHSYLNSNIICWGSQWCVYCLLLSFLLRRFDHLLTNILLSTAFLLSHYDRNFDCFLRTRFQRNHNQITVKIINKNLKVF